jgi:hypothetical protein
MGFVAVRCGSLQGRASESRRGFNNSDVRSLPFAGAIPPQINHLNMPREPRRVPLYFGVEQGFARFELVP